MKNDGIVNILFTSSGRRVELVKHFKKVYYELGVEGKIVTADLKDTSPAGKIADKHVLVPRVDAENYIASLLTICEENNISLIIPLIDTELILLSKHKADFEAIGVRLLISSVTVHEICNDKILSTKFFGEAGFDVPMTYDTSKEISDSLLKEKLLLKPANGSSGIGVHIIDSREELDFHLKYTQNPILQELIIGAEYTIDVYTDFEGNVLTAVPRLRIETRAGEVSKGKTSRNELLIQQAKAAVEALPGAVGCITVQCFLTKDNKVKFIEINPRFGGGAPLSLEAGADYAHYLLEYLSGRPITVEMDTWRDNLLMLRYDAAVFVEGE